MTIEHGNRRCGKARVARYGTVLMVSLASAAWGTSPLSDSIETRFLDESETAMATMMSAMQPAASGDVDRDFATMMIPHHQGAIDMAISELRYGSDTRLRRIAQEIVVDQTQEIAVMRTTLDHPAAPSGPVAGRRAVRTAPMGAMHGMRSDS